MLVSLGDLVTDVTVVPTGPIRPGDDTPARVRIGGGGQAANWCAWVAHLGGPSRLVTRVGRDPAGRQLVEELEEGGVQVCAVRTADPTGAIVVLVDAAGGRSFFTERGAVLSLRSEELRREWLSDAALLHLPLYSLLVEPLAGAARHAARWARDGGALLSVDLSSAAGIAARGAPALVDELRELRPELLFATRNEAAALDAPLDELAAVPVLKLGRDGCWLGDRPFPAAPTEVVDATGAGDAFAAAFCRSYARERDAAAAAHAALEAGARAVGRLGARP
ncbi:MAG TPA: carbohydrate kinase family protein [Chloroflexota bacterium]